MALLALSAASTAEMRAADAARAGARAVALGEDPEVVREVVSRVAGAGAGLSTSEDGEWVTVSVTVPVVSALPFGPLEAEADAVARTEP
ncbi:TadE family type IV pilus minor pilin [Paraoerskovia sediminicola]|uniref:TadE family type IV pilus minor pilin n=1 Tax=Paraoerskovia sediminicola TaxID=1138587 RepID=UPI002572DD8E|nr:TadE family type IV pilus minor pilin [Paraoerskovia sediminicola]